MIHGIGVDIVKVERMHAGLQRFGHRFSRRILTSQEHAEFESRRCPPRFLASRFAAKEAFSKALGTGFRDGLTLRTLSVSNNLLGRPLMICTGRAAQILEDLAIGSIHLSLSDEIEFAVAFVVLECAAPPTSATSSNSCAAISLVPRLPTNGSNAIAQAKSCCNSPIPVGARAAASGLAVDLSRVSPLPGAPPRS